MTIELTSEFWRNQEIPEKFWKSYDQVKQDLFQDFFLIPDFIFISGILPKYTHIWVYFGTYMLIPFSITATSLPSVYVDISYTSKIISCNFSECTEINNNEY